MRKQNNRKVKPPRLATRFLHWYCRPNLVEDLEGDLNEFFDRNVKSKGATSAKIIYILDVFKFLRIYTVRKPQSLNLLIQWIMIGSYIKTSSRSIVRHKLFSTINIVGLAVSMSVALVIVACVMDLHSFDDFHEKKDRIYRVITTNHTMALASTSVKAGKKIKETISGIETLSLLRRGFGGTVALDKISVPIQGIWADESFFKIFSFPFLHGNPVTALKEPYSMVLTEQSAKKIFGMTEVLGRSLKLDELNYVVTGVLKDIPRLSHLQFEALGSFATVELQQPDTDGGFMNWESVYMNYVYIVLPEQARIQTLETNLHNLCRGENSASNNAKISLSLQPLKDIVLGKRLVNQIGPVMSSLAIWILGGLGVIVILSACFNYTNLSIARALRRSREVGIRKVIGASKGHVFSQLMTESVIIAMVALIFAFVIFLFLRDQFLSLDNFVQNIFSLSLSFKVVIGFIILGLAVGLIAGLLPALFFSNLNSARVLKDVTSVRVFRHVNLRKSLMVVQYIFSLIFITATVVGYKQYKSFLTYDLGFTTENIINIPLQGNKASVVKKELLEMPEVSGVSQSLIIMSLGNIFGSTIKYNNDSIGVWSNFVDEYYLPLHKHDFVAGKNFTSLPEAAEEQEVIINEQALHRFNIANGDAAGALGEQINIDGKDLKIVGIVENFHYETLEDNIEPMVFRYFTNKAYGYLNVKVATTNWADTRSQIEKAWQKVDKIHPLEAKFYDDQLEAAYGQFSMMLKILGFLGLLCVCIASMGLFGMVVFTTETRLKEISIRKVCGASEIMVVVLLSKGFLTLLSIAALIALPVTYVFFEKVILNNFAYHEPVGFLETVAGLVGVMALAMLMVLSQTVKVARSNPADVLKVE
jgi:ABC-type antimicrobial peptide transport system permease subunit